MRKMVNNCCVVGCANYVGKKKGLGFYRFPLAEKERCAKWMAAVRREQWQPKPHTRICSEHFESGKPHSHPSHPDYVPSVFPNVYKLTPRTSERRISRLHRRMERDNRKSLVMEREKLRRQEEEELRAAEEERLLAEARARQEEEEVRAAEEQRRLEEEERLLAEAKARQEEEELRAAEEHRRLAEAKARQKEEEVRAAEKQRRLAEAKARQKEKELRAAEEQRHLAEAKARLKEEELRAAEEQRCLAEAKARQKEEELRAAEEERRLAEAKAPQKEEELRAAEEERRQAEAKARQEELELRAAEEQIHEAAETTRCEASMQTDRVGVVHTSQQTVECMTTLEAVTAENIILQQKLARQTFGVTMIEGNDHRTSFYTGLSSWALFLQLFQFLSPNVHPGMTLSLEDEFFLVLVRLRLGLLLEDLASRFGISVTVAFRSFQKWLEVMHTRFQFLIKWPERDVVRKNMPPAFKQLYPKCVCIIDCSEIFIDIPANFEARTQTYSNYKKHNTIKFLIGITPCGSISFLSHCWGGKVSDKVITQDSNFFRFLQPGDVVLADRGFTIADDLAVYGAKLEIPAFTRGKNQLLMRDVELSKQLSTVRIHVERVIGNLKKKYRILKGPIPITMLKHKDDTDVSNIDKLLHVCAALTNLSGCIV